MRTLTFLTALFLLALLAQAEPLPEKAEDAPEEQQSEEEDHNMTISYEEAESSDPQNAGRQKFISTCHCRLKGCRASEIKRATCLVGKKERSFCCS